MKRISFRARRVVVVLSALIGVIIWLIINPESYDQIFTKIENNGSDYEISETASSDADSSSPQTDSYSSQVDQSSSQADQSSDLVSVVLEKLEVKGRSPKTNYDRELFYSSWPTVDGCNLRQKIIKREFGDSAVLDGCTVLSGEYDEPYTGEHKVYSSKSEISKQIQIDHVVALSDAWQKGADLDHMDSETRHALATDPLNLLAVDATANQSKSDGDAATWLPPNKKFRCQYVARQVSVKYKYNLWVTAAEKSAIQSVLESCPNQKVVGIEV